MLGAPNLHFFNHTFIRIVNNLISVAKLLFSKTIATICVKKSILKNTYHTVATYEDSMRKELHYGFETNFQLE